MRWINFVFCISLLVSCKKKEPNPVVPLSHLENGILVLCEGLFQQNNASLSWVNWSDGSVDTDFFNRQNARLLGDTGNDMQQYGGRIYVVVTNSNTLEVLSKYTGKSIKQLKMVNGLVGKQPRSITFSGSNAFVTCFDGYVDVIDTVTLTCTKRIPVGLNPDGIVLANGKLFVSNSGGLNAPSMDSTLSVIALSNLEEIAKINVGKNPGALVFDGDDGIFAVVRGDYATLPSRMVRIDANNLTVEQTFPINVTHITRMETPYLLLSNYDYSTNQSSVKLFNTITNLVENNSFIPTSMIQTLYGVYFDSTRNKVFCLDAMQFIHSGYLRQFAVDGTYEKSYKLGLNPSKLLLYE